MASSKPDTDAHWTIYLLICLSALILAKLHYPANPWFARVLIFGAGSNIYLAGRRWWEMRK